MFCKSINSAKLFHLGLRCYGIVVLLFSTSILFDLHNILYDSHQQCRCAHFSLIYILTEFNVTLVTKFNTLYTTEHAWMYLRASLRNERTFTIDATGGEQNVVCRENLVSFIV